MSTKKLLLLAIVFLSISFIFLHFSPKPDWVNNNNETNLIRIIPERLRAFLAARLWEKADHTMHKGPVVSGQKFMAGSYAGNTDIIPYLEMVILLCPEETAPYRLLAGNYAYHLGMKNKAVEILEKAFLNCKESVFLHELYASASFIHLFNSDSAESDKRKKDLETAKIYIDRAIDNYKDSDRLPDPVFKKENYYTVKARILWELREPESALKAWQLNGINLEESHDKLSEVLLKYKQTGVVETLKTIESEQLYSKEESLNINKQAHTAHKHDDSFCNDEHCSKHEKSLLQTLKGLCLKAGLVSFFILGLYFLCSESCGIGSFLIRFSAGK